MRYQITVIESLLFPEEPFVEARAVRCTSLQFANRSSFQRSPSLRHRRPRPRETDRTSLLFPEEPFVEAQAMAQIFGSDAVIAPLSRGALR